MAGPQKPSELTASLDRTQAPVTAGADAEIPRQIGPYHVLRKVGEGGMGIVLEARQEEPIRRTVALKLVKWGMDTVDVLARFDSERRALALMDHPNIARVYDAGATPAGRPYFVMEFVPGIRITEYCDRRRLDTRHRLELFLDVCDGVQHAHQKGVIHRDIKPSNVLVRVDEERPTPKIIDFGLAKATIPELDGMASVTAEGRTVGTPAYMSPEQILGLDLDTRVDVYMLGMLLYELLVGTLPFAVRSGTAPAIEEIWTRIRDEDPPNPSHLLFAHTMPPSETAECRGTDPRTLRHQLRGDLDWIVMKALEKDRGRRYPSASGLAADIRHHLQHQPVIARPPSRIYRARKFFRRHRLGVSAGIGMALALLAGLALASVGWVRSLEAESAARQEAGRAAQEAATANEVSEFLVGLFELADPRRVGDDTVTVRELLDRGARSVREELRDQPEVQAHLMDTMGRVYRGLGSYEQARSLLTEAVETRERLFGAGDPRVADSLNGLSLVLWQEGDYDGARAHLTRALEIRERELGPDHPLTAKTVNNLAILHRRAGDHEQALVLYRRALGTLEARRGPDHPDVAKTLANMAIVQRNLGNVEEAQALYERALRILEAVHGPRHVDVAKLLANLGLLRMKTGDLAGAEHYYRRSLEIREEALGPDHPDVAFVLHNMAGLAAQRGDLDRALVLCDRAQRIWEARLPPDHPYLAENLRLRAELDGKRGDAG